MFEARTVAQAPERFVAPEAEVATAAKRQLLDLAFAGSVASSGVAMSAVLEKRFFA